MKAQSIHTTMHFVTVVLSQHVSQPGKSDVYQEGVAYFNDQPIYAKIVEMGANVKTVEQSDYHYTLREKLSAAITNIHNGTSIKDAIQQTQDDIDFAMEE